MTDDVARIFHRVVLDSFYYTRAMLQIADEAVDALKQMGALRITAEDVDGEVEIAIEDATEPADGDETIERDGAIVYLDSAAATVLADQVLGVHAHDDHFHFSFDDQQT
jgi:Fe-S cluster assembly iron-binding protein IscA